MPPRVLKLIGVALLASHLIGIPDPADAMSIKGLFSSGDVKPYSKKGESPDAVRQQTEEALAALTSLTFLSESDARQYARNPQSLLGYYAYVDENDTLVLLGGTRKVMAQEFDLKNDVIFRGVVKQGYDVGIGIPVLKVDVKNNQVAELSIQDVVTVSSGFSADQIACGFPRVWRAKSLPAGPTQFYYVPNATVSVMQSRRFNESNKGMEGVFTMLNIGASQFYSDETVSTKYFVTVSLTPVQPLDDATCERVTAFTSLGFDKSPWKGVSTSLVLGEPVNAGVVNMTDLDVDSGIGAVGADERLVQSLNTRANPEALQGSTLSVAVERFPDLGLSVEKSD